MSTQTRKTTREPKGLLNRTFTPGREYRYQDDPEWIQQREAKPRAKCPSCGGDIYTDADGYTNKGSARLQRGAFFIVGGDGEVPSDAADTENLKVELYICEVCWLTDPDLCAFFNRIGYQVR